MSEGPDKTAASAVARVLIWRPVLMATYLVSLMVLARLLDPEAFGTFAIVTAAYWLAYTIIDFGVSAHLIRGRQAILDTEELASAHGFWIATASLATLATACAAWAVSQIDAPDELSASLWIICLAMPLAPITRVHETQRLRALDSSVLAWMPAVAALVAFGVSVSGVHLGWSAAALAAGLLAERATYALMLVWATGRGTPARFQGWQPFLAFGSKFTTTELLPKLSDLIRLSIIGVVLGSPAVGVLNRATHVAKLNDRVLIDAILPFALPMMAAALRDGRSPAEVYRAKFDYLSAVAWPAALVVAVMAEPLVFVLLGEAWAECVPLVRLLAVTGLVLPITQMSTKYFALLGLEGEMLKITWTQHLLMLALVSIGVGISLTAVCVALVVAACIKALRVSWAVKQHVPGAHVGLPSVGLRSLIITALSVLGPMVCIVAVPDGAVFALFATSLLTAGIGWIGAVIVTGHPLGGHIRTTLEARLRPS